MLFCSTLEPSLMKLSFLSLYPNSSRKISNDSHIFKANGKFQVCTKGDLRQMLLILEPFASFSLFSFFFFATPCSLWASLVAQLAKNLPARQETWVRYLGQEDHLEKGKATHSSILAWTITWTNCTVHGVAKSRTQLSDFHFHM